MYKTIAILSPFSCFLRPKQNNYTLLSIIIHPYAKFVNSYTDIFTKYL